MTEPDIFSMICECVAVLYSQLTDAEVDELEVVIRGHQLQLQKVRT